MTFWAKPENAKVNKDMMNRVFKVFMIVIVCALIGRYSFKINNRPYRPPIRKPADSVSSWKRKSFSADHCEDKVFSIG